MIEDDITIHLIAGIIDGCRRILGENAIKTANEVDGLDVRSNGEIVVTGEVPDVVPYLARATVFAAPMRAASGSNLKILEAMALGKPVVTTTMGGVLCHSCYDDIDSETRIPQTPPRATISELGED